MLYSDEIWTGIEYQVAAHMIYEGLVDEAFAICQGRGATATTVSLCPPIARNPWCEIECGGHYARAMSSWSLLLALSGWHYDPAGREICAAPPINPAISKSFFSAPAAWGQPGPAIHARKAKRANFSR